MDTFLKKTGWVSILTSLIFAIFGIVLITNPDTVFVVITYIIGALFILVGVSEIIHYVASKENFDLYNYDLIYGIIAIVTGIVTIICNGAIEAIFRIVIGTWIIYSGVIRLGLSFKFKDAGLRNYWISTLLISVAMIVAGIYVVLNSGAIIATLGAIMLIYAIMDLIESIIFIKKLDNIL